MTEFLGLLNAWLKTDGTLQFLWILIPILSALLTSTNLKKGARVFLAVLSLLLPLAIPMLLPTNRPFATLDWVIISAGFILVALVLAWSHYRQVGSSVKEFYDYFNKNEMRSSPQKEDLVAEGASSFKVLIYGIYGLAGLLGSVACYFYIGVTRTPQGFVFQNNEGFIAALSLLIIVLAGAAVPIYTDLAKQVRTEIDTYESQISSLQQIATNVGHHADFVWTHFERVARVAIREWSSNTEPKDIAHASHLMLFMPFNALFLLRSENRISKDTTLVELRDEIFKNFLADEPNQNKFGQKELDLELPLTNELLLKKMPGAEQHYFTQVPLEATSKRVRLLLEPDLPEKEDRLNILDRRHRARRLTYLGWSMQGPMAIAQARKGSGSEYVFAPNEDPNQPLRHTTIPTTTSASWEFHNSSKDLLPATEELFVALLQQKYQAEYECQVEYRQARDSDVSKAPTTFVHEVQEEYKRRAARHIQRWSALDSTQDSSSLSRELSSCGNDLDLDISTLCDDLQLFSHFYIATKEGMNQGADARFLYYSFWLLALTNSETRVSATIHAAIGRQSNDNDEKQAPQKRLEALFEDFQRSLSPQLMSALGQGATRPSLEFEFTLLSLADHKSALYNWLRAAKSVSTRKKLADYEKKLDTLQRDKQPEIKQLGIEVIPSRQNRIDHLRQFLDIPETQPPLTVRSIFDLLPVDSPSTTEQRRQRVLQRKVYGEYRTLVELLQVSKAWGLAVAIDNRYTRKVVRIDSRVQGIENEEEIDLRAVEFLNWLGRVFGAEPVPDEIRRFLPADDAGFYLPLASALWYVSPTFRQEIEEGAVPANSRKGLSENDRTTQLREIHRKVYGYCLNPDNAEDMKNTFFGGQDPATRNQAGGQYEAWRTDFEQRTIRNE